jgi:hypothetical protein
MSEFLQNLRAKQNKRYDGNRRQYPNPQYQDRRNNEKDNRKQQQVVATAVETLSASLVETLPVIKTILEGISENQKKLAEAEDRRARAEERKAVVLESIFEYAKQYIGSGINFSGIDTTKIATEKPKDTDMFAKETVAEPEPAVEFETTEPSAPGREEVLAMIGDMREKGSTYDQIAKHLETEEIPTFSRKGQWRGQTVHRLYQKMTS